jgi:y4mF family transcriptional regulator
MDARQVTSAQEFGAMIKRVRKELGMTQPDLAAASGTGIRFIVDLEKGKPTCELGKALQISRVLGIKLKDASAEEAD